MAGSLDHSTVRRFWCGVFLKCKTQQVGTSANEVSAIRIIGQHPEFFEDLGDMEAATTKQYLFTDSNPFLHLSLHLALEEQIQNDFPKGIRQLYAEAKEFTLNEHQAAHLLTQSLKKLLDDMAANGQAMSPQRYLSDVKQHIQRLKSGH